MTARPLSVAPDANEQAANLTPGSIDKMHRQVVKAVERFWTANQDKAETPVLVAILSTHVLDMLFETLKRSGADMSPGKFEQVMSAFAGQVERGEHRYRSVQ